MKKNRLLLLILIALFALPVYVKADGFLIEEAGFCNKENDADVYMAEGKQICYVRGGNGTDDANRNIVLIKDDSNFSLFCLAKDDELGRSYYNSNGVTHVNSGYACAVYNAINNNEFTVQQFESFLGELNETTGYRAFNFTLPAATNKIVKNVAAGSGTDIYSKIQFAMWHVTPTEVCNPSLNNEKLRIAVETEPTVTVSAPALKQDAATDSYYYSKVTVTINPAREYAITLVGAPTGTILSASKNGTALAADSNGSVLFDAGTTSFYILVPATSVNENLTFSFKVDTYYTAAKVLNNVRVSEQIPTTLPDNQKLATLDAGFTDDNKLVTKSINVKVDNNKIDFKVCKKDSKTNKVMDGVTFKITSADNSTTFELTTDKDTGCAVQKNVKKAVYTVHEVKTRDGYIKQAKDGEVKCTNTASGEECIYNATNTPITLKVRKLDESNKPLKDAKMQILDKDGKVFDEWKSDVTEDHIVDKNIPFGKYTLREQEAPAGYVIATSIEFEIKEDGYTIAGGKLQKYDENAVVTVTMKDDVTKVSILKVNDNGEPLAGAKLRIEKEDGTVVGEEWVSTTEPKEFTKLAFGTYYLVELEAPEGYLLQEERQPFTVSKSAPDQEIVIKNVEVPNTAANKSALLISFAMLDIALGIAIILYVRKRKVTE